MTILLQDNTLENLPTESFTPNYNQSLRTPPGLKGMRGKKPLPFKLNKKRAEEVEFKPNFYQPAINLSFLKTPNAEHEFDLDVDGLLLMVEDAIPILDNVAAQMYPGKYSQQEVAEALQRTADLAISKKLTYACESEVKTKHYNDFKYIKNAEVKVPTFISSLSEGIGNFELHGNEFKTRQTALHQFNHFAHACTYEGENGFKPTKDDLEITENWFFVNQEMKGYAKYVHEFVYDKIYAWSQQQEALPVKISSGTYTIKPFLPDKDSVFSPTWSEDIKQAGWVIPSEIEKFAKLLVQLSNLSDNENQKKHKELVPFLKNAGFYPLTWNPQSMGDAISSYIDKVQLRYSEIFSSVFRMENLIKMSEYGRPWQLVSPTGSFGGYSAFSISAADTVTGYMLGTRDPNISINPKHYSYQAASKTQQQARNEVLVNSLRAKDN